MTIEAWAVRDEDEIEDFEDEDDFVSERDDERCAICNRATAGESCCQCGSPLCPMCFECHCGFCCEVIEEEA